MAAPVRLIRVTPGAHTLRELLGPRLEKAGEVRLTAFSSPRLALLRELFGNRSNVEITEFGATVSAVFAERAGMAPLLPPRGLIEAALSQACRDLDEDSMFYRVRAFPGFHRVLMRNWETLRSYGVELPSIGTEKCTQLAAIYSRAEQLLNQLGRRFNAETMAACPDFEPEDPPFGRLIVVAGADYRPAEFDWLEWLAGTGVEVEVVAERHAGGASLFSEAERIEGRFGEALPFDRASNPLAVAVFAEGGAVFPCEILETPDVISECEWVLRRTRACEGRVAIFCRNLDSYGPILQATADRFGLPLSISRRFPLMATSMARTMVTVLQVCASPDVRGLMRLARSSYFTVASLEARKDLEEACREAYRKHGGAWDGITAWATTDGRGPDWLRELLAWRAEALAEQAPVEAWRERLIQLATLPSLSAPQESESEPAIELPGDEGRLRERDAHAVTAMLRSLAHEASVDRITARRPLTLGEFARLCRRLWDKEEVSLEPLEVGIQVVNSAESIGPVDTLFVMGMLEGEFPRRRTEDALFTDAELHQLSPNVPIPDSVTTAAAERDEFYRACCAPSSGLVLSYPRVDDDRDNVPAFYLEEIRRVTGLGDPTRFSRRRLVPEEPILTADVRLAAALNERSAWPPQPSLELDEARAIARGQGESYKPGELADAFQCPFRFFAHYRLDLRPSQERMRWTSLNSLPRKANLAAIDDRVEAETKLRALFDDHLGSLIADAMPHDYKLMQAGGDRLISDWLAREFQARTLWPRESANCNQVGFESGHLRARIKLRDGRFVQLSGQVDAISERGDLQVIHLHRGRDPVVDSGAEGEARFHPHEQLEMGIYLLMREPRDRPAGVEVDHARGRRLVTLGLPVFPRQDIKAEMRVTAFEPQERSELLTGMVEKLQVAVDRIQSGQITPTPEETRCHFCEYGELCRRSHRFSEVDDDPFQIIEEDNGILPNG